MRKQLLCLSLAILFLVSGCSPSSTLDKSSDITTTATNVSTMASANESTDGSTANTTTASASTTTGETIIATDTTTSHTSTTKAPSTVHTAQTSTTTIIHTTATSVTLAEQIVFRATVRENLQNKTVANVLLTVFTGNSDTPAGSAVTDANGVALITITKATAYRVTISNLPTGYVANAEYRFSSNVVNVTIRKVAVQNEEDHSEAQYEVGQKMTDFSLTDSDSKNHRLSQLLKEKKLIILDFWFANCAPCKSEFPYFEAATRKYSEEISLLAVNPIDSDKAITQLREQLGSAYGSALTFPMLRDTCNLYKGFGVTAYPTTVFIDSNGVILDIHVGAYPSEAAFFAAIEQYL